MKNTIHYIKCTKCNAEKSVQVTITNKQDHVDVNVKKCTKCKNQMYVKEIFKDMIN